MWELCYRTIVDERELCYEILQKRHCTHQFRRKHKKMPLMYIFFAKVYMIKAAWCTSVISRNSTISLPAFLQLSFLH